MKRLTLALLLLLLLSTVAQARVDAPLLRDVICEAETRGFVRPEWRLGVDKLDLGLCQIRYESAVLYGRFDPLMRRTGNPSRDPGDLFTPETSRAVALEIVALCIAFYPSGDAQRIAYCYSAGLWSEPGSNERKWNVAGQRAVEYARRNQMRLARR